MFNVFKVDQEESQPQDREMDGRFRCVILTSKICVFCQVHVNLLKVVFSLAIF